MGRKTKFEIEIDNFRTAFNKVKDKRIALYGIGRRTSTLLPAIPDYNVIGLLDKEEASVGMEFAGKRVISLKEAEKKADMIIINSDPSNYEIIYRRIAKCKIPVYYANGKLGEMCISEDTYSHNEYWNATYEKLLERIDNADIVSFDCFDTLMMRYCFSPENIYYELAINAKNKYGIEHFDNIRRNVTTRCANNASLLEMYWSIKEQLCISKKITMELYEYEIATETKYCVKRNKVVEAMKYAISQNKQVLVVSDTPYLSVQIQRMLEHVGIECNNIKIYTSCEAKADKESGDIWEYITNVPTYRGKRILHVGDNKDSDIEIPHKYGIETFYIMSAKQMMVSSSIGRIVENARTHTDNICLGIIAEKLFNNPFVLANTKGKVEIERPDDYGFCVYGPVILRFFIWLYNQAIEDEINQLLFLSRDGYFLKEDFDYFLEYIADKKYTFINHYFLISRRAAMMANAMDNETLNNLINFPYNGYFADYMKSRLNIVVDSRTKDINDKYVIIPTDIHKIINSIYLYEKEIENEISVERISYMKYITSNFNMNETTKLGCVDLGYYGTNQYYLQKILGKKIIGYCLYACLSEKNEYLKQMKMKGCFQDREDLEAKNSVLKKKNMVLETFLTAPHGMVRYFDRNGRVVCEENKKSQHHFDIKIRVNTGILRYIQQYLTIVNTDAIKCEANMGVEVTLFELFLNGAVDYADNILDGFYFDNDFCGSKEVKLEL
ncbi:MAG: hypothetical protein Q4D29_08325 [Lachnospiraceae bacterium]|nr:hypothetical protein [Lachnospiraceae bacterium]